MFEMEINLIGVDEMFKYQAEAIEKRIIKVDSAYVYAPFSEASYLIEVKKAGRIFQVQSASIRNGTFKLIEVGLGKIGTDWATLVECKGSSEIEDFLRDLKET